MTEETDPDRIWLIVFVQFCLIIAKLINIVDCSWLIILIPMELLLCFPVLVILIYVSGLICYIIKLTLNYTINKVKKYA